MKNIGRNLGTSVEFGLRVSEFCQSQEVRRSKVSRCSPNSLKGKSNFIAEAPLLYLSNLQQAAGHAEPGTTKLYDRRGYNPEKSASFFATY